jgi:hypothetical protein
MLHLPIIVSALITVTFSLDAPFLGALKTERTFGWWLVLLVPLAIILGLSQVAVWAVLLTRRMGRKDYHRGP